MTINLGPVKSFSTFTEGLYSYPRGEVRFLHLKFVNIRWKFLITFRASTTGPKIFGYLRPIPLSLLFFFSFPFHSFCFFTFY